LSNIEDLTSCPGLVVIDPPATRSVVLEVAAMVRAISVNLSFINVVVAMWRT
jgi:hypothetical protein